MTARAEAARMASHAPAHDMTPAGWRLTLPLANLRGEERAKAGSWAAAIADKAAARRAIP